MTWHSVVKIQQSLYREAPGLDPFRPDQKTPVPNFFLAGSYTKQVPALPRPPPRLPLCRHSPAELFQGSLMPNA